MSKMILKAFKFKIYPKKDQISFLNQQFGATRFIYNYYLNKRKLDYLNNNKKFTNYYDDAKDLTELKSKEEYKWLNSIIELDIKITEMGLDCRIEYQRPHFFQC